MNKILRIFCINFVSLVLLIVVILPGKADAPTPSPWQQLRDSVSDGDTPVLIIRAGNGSADPSARRLAPKNFLNGEAAQLSVINVNYRSTCSNCGAVCKTWDSDAKAAFEYSKAIWETLLSSNVQIVVDAYWCNLSQAYGDSSVLGGTLATDAKLLSYTSSQSAWYVNALANRISGYDMATSQSDITVYINSGFSSWYKEIDGNPGANEYDMVSVIVHELAHGLGFMGSMYVQDGMESSSTSCGGDGYGCWGEGTKYPFVFDLFAENSSGTSLVSGYSNKSLQLGSQLTGDNLYFDGPKTLAANGGSRARLYAPSTWESGSSFSHLDEDTYTDSTGEALMSPYLDAGEVNHDPGDIAMGIMADIGWTVASPEPEDSYTIQVPMIASNYSMSSVGISGVVTENGEPASDVTIELHLADASSDTTSAEVKTGTDGSYLFKNPASLSSGQYYYVRYQNDADDLQEGRLYLWRTPNITTYTKGTELEMDSFDIADVELFSPADNTTTELPLNFTWVRRSSTTTDSYEFDLYGQGADPPLFYTSPLGYVNSYAVEQLPRDNYSGASFKYNVPYYWEIWVYAPDGGYGISQTARMVTFSVVNTSAPSESLTEALSFEELLQIREAHYLTRSSSLSY